jgi:hypothetical protein
MPTPRDLLVELLHDLVPSCRILECAESRFRQYLLSVELPGKWPTIVLLPSLLSSKLSVIPAADKRSERFCRMNYCPLRRLMIVLRPWRSPIGGCWPAVSLALVALAREPTS